MSKQWTMTEKKLLSTLLHLTDKAISKLIPGTTSTSVQAARKRFGLLKPIDSGRFKSDQTPWNKGANYHAGGRSKETQFKKGIPNGPVRKLGEVFPITDGTDKIYLFIKLQGKRQYPYGRYVWEQNTGEVLSGNELITFIDGNQQNCSFGNLKKITKRENALRNHNRKKAAAELKKTWAVVKTFEDFGLTSPYKYKSKRKVNIKQ